MRLKLIIGLAAAVISICTAYPAFAQSVMAATGPLLYSPLAVGVGFNIFDPDRKDGFMYGGALWIDYLPSHLPLHLKGLGIEVLARDVSIGGSSNQSKTQREDVASGGLIYAWPHYRALRPYGKFEMGFGNCEYYALNINREPFRFHQSRTITSMGGGLDFHISRSFWGRVDYEYQSWPDFYYNSLHQPIGSMNPQGVTIGTEYRIGSSAH
jgi:hypothetical protein